MEFDQSGELTALSTCVWTLPCVATSWKTSLFDYKSDFTNRDIAAISPTAEVPAVSRCKHWAILPPWGQPRQTHQHFLPAIKNNVARFGGNPDRHWNKSRTPGQGRFRWSMVKIIHIVAFGNVYLSFSINVSATSLRISALGLLVLL